MNVLFHCYEFPPQAGGVGGYIYQMASCLERMGHRAVVVTSRSPGLPEKEKNKCGLVYRIYTKSETRTKKVVDTVLSLAEEHKADVIEGADHHGELAGIIRIRKRPPVLIKIHGSNPIGVLQKSQIVYQWQNLTLALAHLRNWRQTRDEKFSIENADMALIPSERLKNELIKQGLKLPYQNAVLPNPVLPFEGFKNTEADHPTVLLVARIDAGKGIQYLREIVQTLAARFPDVTLEIAGEDAYARGIGSMKRWLINQLGGDLAKHVHFLGRLDSEQLNEAYGRAWVVILPSRWDNFPTVLLESMVRGKPVVASPHGGMPEMLEGAQCKTALPDSPEFADLTTDLLKDSDLRKRLGENLTKRAREAFSPEIIVDAYINILRKWGVAG